MSATIFSFSSNSHRDTIIFTPTGEVLYWVETTRESLVSNITTSVYRRSQSGQRSERELVARLEFHSFSKDMIQYEGKTWELDDMFVIKHEILRRARMVDTEAGVWKWTYKNHQPELLSAKPERRSLVRYHRNMHFLSSSTPTMEVEPEALPFMDLVIIGWIVVMRDIAKQSAASASASASAGASVS